MFEPYNPYSQYGQYNQYGITNPYYSQPQQIPKQNQNVYRPQNIGLQGKVVDSLDVVKATDIPYDGSISYFPLTDGSAIITKQLQQDGASKVVIYKPLTENEDNKAKYITEADFIEQIKNINGKYITANDFNEQIKNINSKDLKELREDIKNLKRKVEDITEDIKDKKEK